MAVAGPRRAHLQVVGREDGPLPRTPDVLLQLPQRPETPPAAAPVLVQLLQQHPLGLREAQLPVIMRTGQQGESRGLEGKTAATEKDDACRSACRLRSNPRAGGPAPGQAVHPAPDPEGASGPAPLAWAQLTSRLVGSLKPGGRALPTEPPSAGSSEAQGPRPGLRTPL